MTNVVPFGQIGNKTRIKNSIFCHFEKIYRQNNNCRVAMTTTYRSTSCNSENIVACGEGLLHACISSSIVIAKIIIYGVRCKQFFLLTTCLSILDQYTMNVLIIKDSGYLDVLFTPTTQRIFVL